MNNQCLVNNKGAKQISSSSNHVFHRVITAGLWTLKDTLKLALEAAMKNKSNLCGPGFVESDTDLSRAR